MAGLTPGDFKPLTGSDFKPAGGSQSGGLSSSDFKPVSVEDFKPVAASSAPTPAPISTPHALDPIISTVSRKYGIDPRVMQAVGMQESGLGTGANYNPRTGRDRDQNRGVSPWQLDPASGIDKSKLDRAAKDPSYAAELSAGMLKRNLQATNGNLREALSMYNSGSRTNPQGLAYADSVLSYMERDQPLAQQQTLTTKLQHDFHKVQTALKHGKSPGQALAHTETFKPLHKLEVKGVDSWNWLKAHPLEGALDVLGAPQRALGGAEYEAMHGHHFQNVWDYVFNPTEKNQEKTTRGAADALGMPTHAQIDKFVRNTIHTPAALQPYVSGILKAGEDFTSQTLSDPLVVSGVGRGLVHLGLHSGVQVAKAAQATAKMMGLGSHFEHLGLFSKLGEASKDMFGVRRDLDKAGFTEKGKKVRLSIENAELNKATKDNELDRAASHSADEAKARYLQYVHQHGNGPRSAEASKILGRTEHAAPTGHMQVGDLEDRLAEIHDMTPGEREDYLLRVRRNIARKEANRKTEQVVRANKGLHEMPEASLSHLTLEDTSPFMRALDSVEKSNPMARLANLGKRAILWNPIPHGLVNVGTLAYQAGGIPAVMRGFSHMIKGTDPAAIQRLRDMGALTEYANTASTAVGKGANQLLQRMEEGWRAGLLDELDRKLGKSSPGSVEELLKGRMISEHVGDYRNQSAFVKMFQALGGPFVAFRLGIVPQQFLRTLRDNPERILQQLRAVHDIQENRQGKKKNELVAGGPTHDVLQLMSDPMHFFQSPSTSGVLGQLLSSRETPQGILDMGMSLAEAYIPGAENLVKFGQIAEGQTTPGQKMSIADKLANAIEETFLNMYYKKQETPKQMRIQKKKVEKEVGI